MACVDTDTRIYIWVDTSGTVNEAAIQAAVTQLKARLQATVYGDVDVDTRVFYDSSWTNERWVTKLTETTQAAANAIALVFINESGPVYHANSGASAEPTSQYLADHAAFLSAVAGAERFHALLYAVTGADPWYPIFKSHVGKALAGASGYPAGLSGYGVTARLDVNPTQDASVYYRDLMAFLDALCQGSGERLRSSVNESVTSLLESVDARPVDARASEHFTYAQALDPHALTGFREATSPAASADFAYYPRPRQNTVSENQYDGVTLLSRLSTWYPPTIYDSVSALSGGAATRWTAQQVVAYVLGEWASLQPWLLFDPVPDLRLRLTGHAPDDYEPDDGLVTTETITIDQAGDRRRDALSILEDLLSPFPGTVVRQSSSGRLSIVPTYGPDADSTPTVVMSGWDAYSASNGKPDPFTVVNRATIRSTGHDRQEHVQLMQPAWFQIGSTFQLGRPTWFEPPSDRQNLQPPPEGHATLQETLSPGQFHRQAPGAWPIASDSIPAGSGIGLRDESGNPTITAAWARYVDNTLDGTGTGTLTLLASVIPFTGQWVNAFRFSETASSGEGIRVTMRARWDAASESVVFGFGEPMQLQSSCFIGCRGWVVEFTLNDSSTGYVETSENSATFGILDDGDALPGPDGGNALAASQDAYGLREAALSVRGYHLDLGTLRQIAQAYVVANITPRVTRDVELSSVGSRLAFDHIGRQVALPNSETGLLVALDYSDDFTARSWRKTAQVQLLDSTGAGAISDEDSVWLTSTGDPYRVSSAMPATTELDPFYTISEGEE